MKRKSVMIIAGEASGDAIAAHLVDALSQAIPTAEFRPTAEFQPLTGPFAPRFFGAGGPKMAQAGVELAFDMTADSVIGVSDVFKKLPRFLEKFRQLVQLATEREPEIIILVDFGGFNRRFAHAIRKITRSRWGTFNNWRPKIVQYVSPQVWASRPGRAKKLAKDIDLLLCLFPFEKEWYARHVPELKVAFVGHPMFDNYSNAQLLSEATEPVPVPRTDSPPSVLLLPGSRRAELKRHLPPMLEAARKIAAQKNARFTMVLPNESLRALAQEFNLASVPNLKVQIGDLADALLRATLAIASTGTVTLECAHFGVPTIAIYKTSWSTYLIGRSIIQVRFLAMPNILADEPVFPEFIQHDATAEKIANEALDLLNKPARREEVKAKLAKIVASLGGAGSSVRAANAIVPLLKRGTFQEGLAPEYVVA